MATQVVAPSSSLSFNEEFKYRYDVFLSFRGEDTRHSFAVPLYDALRRKGINAFIDDKKLGKGECIAPMLLKAIKRSRISIIVFSENYATSTWCLDELAQIIRCKNEKDQLVMPIFYKVGPIDVQFQRGSFEAAMAAHEDRFRDDPEKVQKWRSALSEAASLSKVWLFKDRYEIGFIERFVEDAYAMLPPKRLDNPGYTVGLEPRVKEFISLLNQSDDRVYMLGIHGTGGIGKTTLAKLVYKSIFYKYEGACFLFDVKEASKKYRGIVHLQQKLLSEILEEEVVTIGSVAEGISRIIHRLAHKKVLLVLDDVDDVEQLEQLAGGCDWFGYGSKVIITTRNKQLLIARNVEKTYEMMKLNRDHSLELFCWHAFHMNQPPENYQDMSCSVIEYAQGLPLALRVIGFNLADKNLEEWRSILEQYEKTQEGAIHEVLKISYDCLQDGAKRIFLDIACFVDQKMLQSIEDIVEAYDFGARFYLEVLVDKSLITFDHRDGFSMHDLIRQMGREIVRQEAPLNPEKCSRLWHYQDVLKVLRENLEYNNIEGIMLHPPQQEKVKWSGTTFEKMSKLKILIIRNVQFSTGPIYLPNSTRWLEWEGYPSSTLPTDFSPSELVILKLPKSCFTLKDPFKSFTNHVTEMDFSYCQFITEVPDMSQCQSLRRLELMHCDNLIKVHDSVGSLSKLVRLYLFGCTKLSSFPREITMPSLERIDLNHCESLEYFPHVVGNMDALQEMYIIGTAIKELPPSIGNLSSLECLEMNSCKSLEELPTSLWTLPRLRSLEMEGVQPCARKSLIKLIQDIQPIISSHLKNLNLVNCGVLDEELLQILSYFPNLQGLYVSRNDFVSFPKCIKECAQLRELHVNDCKRLRDIPELASRLHQIQAENCTSLTAESFDNLHSQAKREPRFLTIRMPATTFPDWFDYWCEGNTLRFGARGNLPFHALSFEVAEKARSRNPVYFQVCISINGCKTNGGWEFEAQQGHHVSLCKFSHASRYMKLDWNDVEIQIISESPDAWVVKCGVYVFKKETNIMENVQFKCCDASPTSLKRRAMASPPDEPPKKLLRKFNKMKGTMNIKRHQAFHSRYRRRMVFPVGKHVWRIVSYLLG